VNKEIIYCIRNYSINYKQYKQLETMKRLIQSLFSCNYNEIVQCPNTNNITTTLIVGGHTMGL